MPSSISAGVTLRAGMKRSVSARGCVDQQAVLQGPLDNGRRDLAAKVERDEQAAPARGPETVLAGKRVERGLERLSMAVTCARNAGAATVSTTALPTPHQRVAVVGATLVAVAKAADGFRREQRAERHAAADALAEGHDVGCDAGMLIIEEFARAPDAGLDFVAMSSRPYCRVSWRSSLRKAGVAGNTPASPWIGSSMIAMVRSPIRASTDSRSLSRAFGKPAPWARTAARTRPCRMPTWSPACGHGRRRRR